MEKFKKVPTLSGLVSFSPQYHTVFGRQYRVIKIQNNKAQLVGAVTAQGRPEDLESWRSDAAAETRRRPGGTLRASVRLALLRRRPGARRT